MNKHDLIKAQKHFYKSGQLKESHKLAHILEKRETTIQLDLSNVDLNIEEYFVNQGFTSYPSKNGNFCEFYVQYD